MVILDIVSIGIGVAIDFDWRNGRAALQLHLTCQVTLSHIIIAASTTTTTTYHYSPASLRRGFHCTRHLWCNNTRVIQFPTRHICPNTRMRQLSL